jgi:hypothetical protein
VAVVQVRGVRETLRDLKDVEPVIYRETMKNIRKAAAPLAKATQQLVPTGPPLSGMGNPGRFQWTARGSKVAVRTGGSNRRRTSWILVKTQMTGAPGALFDIAGRGSGGITPSGQALIANLNARYRNASRAMWPAAEQNLDLVQRNVIDAIDTATARMNLRLKRTWV